MILARVYHSLWRTRVSCLPDAFCPRIGVQTGPGIVVRVRSLLGGPFVLRHMAQVDADARPRGIAAAHRVDEDVVHLQQRRGCRMARLPALEAGERVLFVFRLGDGNQRMFGLPAAARTGARLGAALLLGARALPARGLHPRRLAGRLLVLRRPRRVAEARSFLCGGQLEQPVQ